MQVIIEGPDNAGKSTLAELLSVRTGLSIFRSSGKPKHLGEINQRIVRDYFPFRDVPMILDRHPAISEPIYGKFRPVYDPVEPELIRLTYMAKPIIIYCRGRDLASHVVKDHDTPEHVAMVETYHKEICALYDAWALEHATAIYRIGDPVEPLIRMIRERFDPVRDIAEFHEKFKLQYDGLPRMLPVDLCDFRHQFMREELDEYESATSYADDLITNNEPRDPGEFIHAMENTLDALVDLVYVALGTSYLHGFDFKTAWERVHRANMSKVRAASAADSKRSSAFDVVKPAGWEAPSHRDLVENHAHRNLFR